MQQNSEIPVRSQLSVAAMTCLCAAMMLLSSCAQHHAVPAKDETIVDEPTNVNFTERIPDSTVAFEMVWIEDGGYWIGQTEVTWDAYLEYCAFDDRDRLAGGTVTKPSKPLETMPADRGWGGGKRPAVGMSRNAARQYCAWLSLKTGRNYRLPTEEEWRGACGTFASADVSTFAWSSVNSDERTQEVATLQADSNGLHDMCGNLWEYCDNPFDAEDPERAVLRGGSWRDDQATCNVDARIGFNDDWVLDDPAFPPGVWWVPDGDHLGFRILCVTDNERED